MNSDECFLTFNSPEEINPSHLRAIIEKSPEPLLFKASFDWPILQWDLKDWGKCFEGRVLTFRKGHKKYSKSPQWERNCDYVKLTFEEFVQQSDDPNHWFYFDYQPLRQCFNENAEILAAIDWSCFGYEKMGSDSTIWIGSEGAHTPCHYDTYGINLIAQIYGRKRWIIFPPSENLRPTRIPYEESSVYSTLNFYSPDSKYFEGIGNGRLIVLEPGDVLFLPSKWWHFVENIETAISVNVWLPTDHDNLSRIEESIVRLLVTNFIKDLTPDQQKIILNPNSEDVLRSTLWDNLNLCQTTKEICERDRLSKRRKTSERRNYTRSGLVTARDLTASSCNFTRIPLLSKSGFENLLARQSGRFTDELLTPKTEEDATLDPLRCLLNALCNPHVIASAKDKFLKGSV